MSGSSGGSGRLHCVCACRAGAAGCAAACGRQQQGPAAAAAPRQPAPSWPGCVQAEGPGRPRPPRRGCGVLGWVAGLPGLARREMARTRARSLAIGDGANDVAMIQARAHAPGPVKRRAAQDRPARIPGARSRAGSSHKLSLPQPALERLQAAGGVRLAPSARALAGLPVACHGRPGAPAPPTRACAPRPCARSGLSRAGDSWPLSRQAAPAC
jgi:hypothetical protein